MARIFISYRHQDSAYPAGILRDALQARFGTDSVFFDRYNIPFGVDFRKYIGNAIGQCDVVLVMIGDQWLRLTDDQGRRRIEDLSDYVRIEIESALKRDIPVVPVLVEEAKMPGASELPESIRDLAYRNAAEIGRGRDQKHQIERLVSDLESNCPTKVSDAEEEKPAASEEPSAPDPRETTTQPNVRESAEPKPPAAVSGAETEKPAAAVQEKRSTPEPRKPMARPKVRKSVKPKPQVTESAPPRLTSVISKAELDRRAAFLKQARKAFKGVRASLWFSGEIPPEKAFAATNSYAPDLSQDAIMLLYDSSLWGGAKIGLLLTVDAIYWRNAAAQARCISYANIQDIKKKGSSDLWINGEEIQLTSGPDAKIAQGMVKLIHSLKPELQAAKSTIALSQSELDRRAAFLKQARKAFKGVRAKLWFSGKIPPEKAFAATNSYAPDLSQGAIMLLYDSTALGGAKEGLLLTVDAIYWNSPIGFTTRRKPRHCRYADIKEITMPKAWLPTLYVDSVWINGERIDDVRRNVASALINLVHSLKSHSP